MAPDDTLIINGEDLLFAHSPRPGKQDFNDRSSPRFENEVVKSSKLDSTTRKANESRESPKSAERCLHENQNQSCCSSPCSPVEEKNAGRSNEKVLPKVKLH